RAIDQVPLVRISEQRTGDGVPADARAAAGRIGLNGTESEAASPVGEAANVEFHVPQFTTELEAVLAVYPTHGIGELRDVVSKFGIAATGQIVRCAVESEAWKGVVINPRQSQFIRVSAAQTARDLATIAPAQSYQKMVEH